MSMPEPDEISDTHTEADTAFAILGSVPLALVAVEAVIALALFFVAFCFMVTIFLGFVGYILLYLGLWLALALNTFGAFFALITLVAGQCSRLGRSLGLIGLLVNGLLLAGAAATLLRVHGLL